MYMNKQYHTLRVKANHLLVWKMQRNDNNNYIKSSASKNDKFTALSLA